MPLSRATRAASCCRVATTPGIAFAGLAACALPSSITAGIRMHGVVLRNVAGATGASTRSLTDLQMSQQIVEFDDQRQEVVSPTGPACLSATSNHLRRHARGFRWKTGPRPPPRPSPSALAGTGCRAACGTYALLARRLAQHGIDHFHGRVGAHSGMRSTAPDRCAECPAGCRPALGPGFARLAVRSRVPPGRSRPKRTPTRWSSLRRRAPGENRTAGQRVSNLPLPPSRCTSTSPNGIDVLDQLLVGALGPEDFDELDGCRQSPLRHDMPE